MKISIIYDSRTGNTQAMAGCIAEGIEKVEGAEARTFLFSELSELTDETGHTAANEALSYVRESDALIFGCPTYMAGPTADFYTFLEKMGGKLNGAGKLAGVFATEQYIHGGADVTMLRIAEHLLVFGMMLYSGGGSKGKPVIHFGPVEVSTMGKENFYELFVTYGTRFATQANSLVPCC